MPNFFIILPVFVLQEHRFFALVQLRLADDPLTFFELVLHSALLVNDTPVGEQSHRFSTSEVQQNVVIGHKKHLFDFVQLLEPYDTDLAGARSRL